MDNIIVRILSCLSGWVIGKCRRQSYGEVPLVSQTY